MKRVIVFALPLLLLGALIVAGLAVYRRRSSRLESAGLVDQHGDTRAGTAGAGVEVLVGYDEQHEEEEETRHGALLHIDVGKLSVGQF